MNSILKSRAVFGEGRYCGNILPNYYPAIATFDEWSEVQAALASRTFKNKGGRKTKRLVNIFQGMVWDWDDNSICAAIYRGRKPNQQYFLISKKAYRGAARMTTIPYAQFESAFLSSVKELKVKELYGQGISAFDEAERIRNEIAATDESLANLVSAIAGRKRESKSLIAAVEQLELERDRLEQELAKVKLTDEDVVKDKIKDQASIIERLSAATDEDERDELRVQLKHLIALLCDKIWIKKFVREWKPARPKKRTKNPVQLMHRLSGYIIVINFKGGGYRTILVGDVPCKEARKFQLTSGRKTFAMAHRKAN